MQTVGVDEVGVGAAVKGGGLVHQIHKSADGAGHRLGHGVGGVVGGLHQRGVEQIPQGQLLTLAQVSGGHVILIEGDRLGGHGTGHVQIAAHDGQQGRHDFRGGSGVHDLVGVLFKDNQAAAGLHQDGGYGVELIFLQRLGMLGVIRCSVRGKGGLGNLQRKGGEGHRQDHQHGHKTA